MIEMKLVGILKEKRQETATSAVEIPKDRDIYLKMCGKYEAYGEVLDEIEALLRGNEED